VFIYILHARLRVHRAPGIPHALCRAEDIQSSGDSRRGNAELYQRHCEEQRDEAIQLSLLPQESWIASRSLSSSAHSRDPVARNDVVAV
jgi:hypothetical protein